METKIILYFVFPQFRSRQPRFLKQIDWEKVNYSRLLLKAAQNRVLYPFVGQVLKEKDIPFPKGFLSKAQKFFQEGQIREKKLKMTAQAIKKIWSGKVDYYLFKTIQASGALPSDLDILFKNKKDYQLAAKLMKKASWTYKGDDFKGIFRHPGLVPVEPHLTVSWEGREFFSRKFLLKNPQKASFLGIGFRTLNCQAELALQLAQVIFDCQYLVLRDFLSLKNLLKKVKDFKEIEEESKNYGWFEALEESLLLVKKAEREEIELPFWLPLTDYFHLLTRKAIFDFHGGRKIDCPSYLLNYLIYFWKRGRFFLKRQPSFVDSWLY